MWIFLNDAFLSVVDKGGDGTTLLVRARSAGDIARVFPGAEVARTPSNDYRYRARIDRERVAQALAEAARAIAYGNFKGSVQDPDRHDAYMRVWSAMEAWQRRQPGERPA